MLFQQDTAPRALERHLKWLQVEKLGEEPSCSWPRPDQLQVTWSKWRFGRQVRFGSRPSLLLGDPVLLNPGAFGDVIPQGGRGDFVLGATAVAAEGVGDVTVAVVAVLEAPSEATTCGAMRFSAERCTGGAGRALALAESFSFPESLRRVLLYRSCPTCLPQVTHDISHNGHA